MTRVLIAAGGSAGHVMPALAVAEELRRRGADVSFAGTPDRAEARLVPEAGYPFDAFRVKGLPRQLSPTLLMAVAVSARAPFACRAILKQRKPDVVFGAGGFVAGPMLLAARALGIPRALSEADSHLGLANRLGAPLADRVYLAFPIDGLTDPRYRVVGRPVARSFFTTTRAEARASLGLPENVFTLAVFGALAGARQLNDACIAAYGDGSFDGAILHVTGSRDHDRVEAGVQASRESYRVIAQTSHFHDILAAADLCVSRSGGTVWELAAAGLPAILVPYPYATQDHQRGNAEYFVKADAAVLVDDAELTGTRLAREVDALRSIPGRLGRMREAMRACARPQAAREIADDLLALAST